MLNYTRLFTLLLLALAFFACEPEASFLPNPTAEAETAEARLRAYEKVVESEISELEADVISFRSAVVLPAGSNDGLAAAIDEAGPGGTVKVASGLHTESGPVTVTFPVRIIGESGAVLEFSSGPYEPTGLLEPGIHFLGAPGSLLRNVELRVSTEIGGSGVIVENSARTTIRDCIFRDFQFSIWIQFSDNVRIYANEFDITPAWATGAISQSYGIMVANGRKTRVYRNEGYGGVSTLWACDRDGIAARNDFHTSLHGYILCRIPAIGNFTLPSGVVVDAAESGNNWAFISNDAHDNFDTGYQAIDGAFENFMAGNRASNNGRVDYEFAPMSDRFNLPYLIPTSFDNLAVVKPGQTYVDCGENNVVIGGIALDNQDPVNCF